MLVLMKAAVVTARAPYLGRRMRRGGSTKVCSSVRRVAPTAALDDGDKAKEGRLRRMVKVKLTRQESDVVVKLLRELGLDTPRKLRGFLLKTSSLRALLLLSDVGINAIGAACAYASFRLLVSDATGLRDSGANLYVASKYVLAAIAAFGTGWFSSSIAADALVLTMTIVAAVRFGLSADAFLSLAYPDSGPASSVTPAGMRGNPMDSARAAQAALTSATKLDEAMKALQQRGQTADAATSPLSSLRSYFALSQAEERGFKPESLALSPDDMQSVARAFAACDRDDDGQLSVPELRALMADMTHAPCSDDDAQTAMRTLDTDGDGKLSLEEFSRWWSEVRADTAASAASEPVQPTDSR